MTFPTVFYSMSLFAEGAPAPAGPQASSPFFLISVMFMMLIAFYLLLVFPKQRQAKKERQMVDSLKKNDKVMTTSGMIGTIHSIDKEEGVVVLKVDETNNTKITFSIAAIYFVFQDKQ